MADRDDRRAMLRRVPIFAQFSTREVADVADIAAEQAFPAGHELTREGETGSAFYVVVEGEVDIERGGETIEQRGGGEFFGEIALLAHSPRTATVRAKTPVRALVISDRKFRALLGRHPQLQLKVIEALAERL